MTCVLVVTAHPGPDSFTRAWAHASEAGAKAVGHRVLTSDLYAMGFDPAERGALYGLEGSFDPLKAQQTTLPTDAAAEVAKIEAADIVIFHFPIWWFGPPAILKGWCDRALAHGRLHDVDRRFDKGPCKGKLALFCVSTGASKAEVGPRGKEGRLELLLWPLAYTLRYCGFDIATPEAAHSVHGYWEGQEKAEVEARLGKVLAGQKALIEDLPNRSRLQFHQDSDFGQDGTLREGIAPLWPYFG